MKKKAINCKWLELLKAVYKAPAPECNTHVFAPQKISKIKIILLRFCALVCMKYNFL
jgi:hypothetical protein